jgi:hypothetical protein
MAGRADKKPSLRHKGWLAWVLGSADNYEGYFAQSRSLALSFVLIAPLLLVYEVALVMYGPARPRGASLFIKKLLAAVFSGRAGLVLNITVAALLLVAVFVLARRGGLRLNLILPMVLESAGWALLLVGVAVLVWFRLPKVPLAAGGSGPSMGERIITSIGAGVYEEILFRLLLTSLLYLVGLKIFQERAGYAGTFAVSLSALAFALCHDVRPGLPLLFYFVIGLFLSTLYTLRGLGVVVYTHVIYDLIVYLGQRA